MLNGVGNALGRSERTAAKADFTGIANTMRGGIDAAICNQVDSLG